jgi:hypothetical protein
MGISEFYEKCCVIQLANGMTVKPELRELERTIWKKAEELGVYPYVWVKDRAGTGVEVHPDVLKALE